jgi:hypothetical protein
MSAQNCEGARRARARVAPLLVGATSGTWLRTVPPCFRLPACISMSKIVCPPLRGIRARRDDRFRPSAIAAAGERFGDDAGVGIRRFDAGAGRAQSPKRTGAATPNPASGARIAFLESDRPPAPEPAMPTATDQSRARLRRSRSLCHASDHQPMTDRAAPIGAEHTPPAAVAGPSTDWPPASPPLVDGRR